MGNIISTELLKIKRYSVVKAGLVMMSLSVLMSCFYSTASTNKVWDFQYFIQQVIISNCTLFFPIIITLVAVYIISRETTDDTLKSILTVPISYKKLLIAKFWLLLFLTIVFSIFNALLSICFNAFLGFSGMDIHMMLMSAAQIIVSDILVYISVLPIIIVCAFAEGKSLLGVAVAFIYGYFATMEGSMLNWFPIKAAMILVDPKCGSEYGMSYKIPPAAMSIIGVLVVSILLFQMLNRTKKNVYMKSKTSVYKGYKQDKIEMRGDRAEMSDFPLYLNTVAGGLDRRDQTIGGFSFVVKIYAVPVVEIIG